MPTGFRTTKTQAGSYRQGRNSKVQWQRMRKNHNRCAFIGAGALVNTLLWFAGLSGFGKSTIAHSVEERLFSNKCRATVLDGDNVRYGLCGDLGFSKAGIILFFSILDERQRRLYAGLEAFKYGHGGDSRIADLLGLDVHTVSKGRQELFNRDFETGRVRKKGGGRKPVEKKRLK